MDHLFSGTILGSGDNNSETQLTEPFPQGASILVGKTDENK